MIKRVRIKLLSEFKQYNIAYERTKDKYKINSGLLILSKYTILNYGFTKFDSSCGEDSFANKGFLYITIKKGNAHNLLIYNTHLNNPSPVINFFSNGHNIVCQQLYQLLHHAYIEIKNNN